MDGTDLQSGFTSICHRICSGHVIWPQHQNRCPQSIASISKQPGCLKIAVHVPRFPIGLGLASSTYFLLMRKELFHVQEATHRLEHGSCRSHA